MAPGTLPVHTPFPGKLSAGETVTKIIPSTHLTVYLTGNQTHFPWNSIYPFRLLPDHGDLYLRSTENSVEFEGWLRNKKIVDMFYGAGKFYFLDDQNGIHMGQFHSKS